MIRPRQHLTMLERDVQNFNSRDDWLRLDMNEYVPNVNKELYDELLKRITPELISAYPLVNDAYKSLAEYLEVAENNLVLTAGSDGVLFSVLQAFCDPGDKIAYIAPTYGMYEIYARMLNLDIVEVNYSSNLSLDLEEIKSVISPELKVFLFANPNGVFGNSLSREFVEEIVKKANKTGTIILIDEVYSDFVDGGVSDFLNLCLEYDNLVLARSFSKSYGAAGIRLGYSISCEKTRKYIISVRRNVEINSIAIELLKVWTKHREYMREALQKIVFSRHYFYELLKSKGFDVVEGKCNFLLLKVPDFAFYHYLQANKIAVKRIEYCNQKYLRITIGTIEYMKHFENVLNCFGENK